MNPAAAPVARRGRTAVQGWIMTAGVVALALGTAIPAHAQGYPPPSPGTPPSTYPSGYPGYPPAPAPGSYPPGAYPPSYPPSLANNETPPAGAPGPGDDESDDSGLGLEWVWLNADVGYSYTNMTSFSQSSLAMQKTQSGGPLFGIGAGARLLFFTVGVRARDLILSDIGDLWEIGGEAAFHTRIWRIDPYFGVRGGYNFVGTLDRSTVSNATGNTSPSVSIHGFNVGPIFGLDWYFSHYVSVGADVDMQFLFLQRPPVPLPAGLDITKLPPSSQAQAQQLYHESGNSAGIQVSPSLHLGIHF